MTYRDVVENPRKYDFAIKSLGECSISSPIKNQQFVDESEKIIFSSQIKNIEAIAAQNVPQPSFEKAGPRSRIYHDPAWSKAAIVTCGGLCPGLNDVIKGLVTVLHHGYGVKNIFGIRYGYQGLSPQNGYEPVMLDPDMVDKIHEKGGTILGSSRGTPTVKEIVDTLCRLNINMLFTIGGDGTLRGAHEIAQEAIKRGENISVIGIPKTIDNDLKFIERTFGFETAVYTTFEILSSAHNEAEGAYNGIGLVKLMGRDSGFIAAASSLANSVIDFCLIPEVPFSLEGEHGLMKAIERRLERKHHAVIVVAEGAGQELIKNGTSLRDASGNLIKNDIGPFLKTKINEYLENENIPHTVKYFDPSYYIRSVPAQGTDAIFCYLLAEHAVHAAMAGKTDTVIGHWNNFFTHVPIPLTTHERRKLDPEDSLWKGVQSSTRQNEYW